jgi:hypothetical protein
MSSRHKHVCPGAFTAPESGHEQETVHLAQEGLVLEQKTLGQLSRWLLGLETDEKRMRIPALWQCTCGGTMHERNVSIRRIR